MKEQNNKNEETKITKEEVKSAVKVSWRGLLKRMPDMPIFRYFLNSKSAGSVFLKSIILLLIPYAYLFICGFIFDMLLKWYFMTEFIFVSLMILWLIAVIYIIWAWKRYFAFKRYASRKEARRRGRDL